jgi:hypothetical protein
MSFSAAKEAKQRRNPCDFCFVSLHVVLGVVTFIILPVQISGSWSGKGPYAVPY